MLYFQDMGVRKFQTTKVTF